MPTVLMVLSAADHWTLADGSTHPTGVWAEEFVAPYDLFTEAGWDVTIATPGGGRPTIDQASLGMMGGLPPKTTKLKQRLMELADVFGTPANLYDLDITSYDAVFYPGGHGPMEDLAVDEIAGGKLTERLASGKPLALVCHAPAAVLATVDAAGHSPFSGRSMTGFSNIEEKVNPASSKAKWLLEDRIKELGVNYEKALLPMRPHVVVDGNLLTGQNPASSEPLAQAVIDAVKG